MGNRAKAGLPSLILKKIAILGQPPMVKRKPQYWFSWKLNFSEPKVNTLFVQSNIFDISTSPNKKSRSKERHETTDAG